MARSLFSEITKDASGTDVSALFSFVQGEQLEQAISLQFLPEGFSGYTFEAVVIEANNVPEQTSPPSTIRTGGAQHTLLVRVPTYRAAWVSGTSYDTEDVVKYLGLYYRLLGASGYSSSTNPSADTRWELVEKNSIYVQFVSTVGLGWLQEPTPTTAVYGFFELRVTEPSNALLRHTWKPLRGVVEIQYSLTTPSAPSFTIVLSSLTNLVGGGTTRVFITN